VLFDAGQSPRHYADTSSIVVETMPADEGLMIAGYVRRLVAAQLPSMREAQ
jgi:hypothetical protein